VRALTPRNARFAGFVAATMSMVWRLAFVMGATAGCVTHQELALQRASREFRCPGPQIATLPRPDISNDVVDVRACGHVARYSCFIEKYGTHCVREPIEAEDVEAMMSRPVDSPPAETQTVSPATPRPDGRRICRDWSDFNANRNCVLPSR
jgi:hypothetical protein